MAVMSQLAKTNNLANSRRSCILRVLSLSMKMYVEYVEMLVCSHPVLLVTTPPVTRWVIQPRTGFSTGMHAHTHVHMDSQ